MKDCKFCDKSGLLILPLRYAAVVGDDVKTQLPALPATLGAGVSDLALTHGQYAPRLLRQGFVYMLVNRAGIKYWQAYYATEDAFLARFDPETPPNTPIVFTCDRTACGIDASCIAIDKVETVSTDGCRQDAGLRSKRLGEERNAPATAQPDRRIARQARA
jgi:hypothetical protein